MEFYCRSYMIALKSFYNSASIHYFTKNNDIALQVAEEGKFNLFTLLKSLLIILKNL